MAGKAFLHGADYNPEQWMKHKKTVWQEDMLRAKEAGINELSVGIFSWSFLEPEDGVYDFSWLDEVMDMLHQNGMKAILATPSGSRPPWMAQKYPSVLRMDNERKPYVYGARHNACYSSPDFRRKVTEINTRLAQRYANHPALYMWHVSNEYNYDCHCPRCQKAFQQWLENRYGTIDNLNDSWWNTFWSHRFSSFDQVESPTTPSFLGEWESPNHNLAWRRFCSDHLVDFFRLECEPLRKYTPHIPITANLMHTFPGIDYFDLGRAMDVVSWDNYPRWKNDERDMGISAATSFRHDLMRGTGGQKPFLMMESCPGAVNWDDVNTLPPPGTVLYQGLQAIAHGSDSVQYFQFRAGRGGSKQFHGSILPPDGSTDTRAFQEVCEVSAALEKLAPVCGSVTRNPVALVYDWHSRWALDYAWMGHRFHQKYEETLIAHHTALSAAGYGVDIIDQLTDLTPYRAVIAPMAFLLRKGFAERLTAFARAGGLVYLTYLSGYVDEEDLRFVTTPPLEALTGLRTDEIDAYDSSRENSFLWQGREWPVKEVAQLSTLKGAESLAAYTRQFYQGQPVLTRNTVGSGVCYTLQARVDPDCLTAVLGGLLREHGLQPLAAELPAGVTATARYGEDGTEYLFLLNSRREAVDVQLEGAYTDMLSGQEVCGAVKLGAFTVNCFLRQTR